MKESLLIVKDKLYSGEGMYFSLKDFSYIYPEFFVQMVKVGEESGKLAEALEKLGKYYKRQYSLRKEINKALVYPLITFLITNLTIGFLVINILPEYLKILEEFKVEAPKLTIVCFVFFTWIYKNFHVVILFIITSLYLWKKLFKNGNKLLHKFIFKIPYIGNSYKKLQISRMFSSLGFMLDSGINIVEAINKACNTLNSLFIIETFNKAAESVLKGESFSYSLLGNEIINKKYLTLITSGEEKGELPQVLTNLSLIQEEELIHSLSKSTKYIEPILIGVMSILVGVLVIAFFIPIIKLMDSLIGI